jgi:putative transposase
MARLPRLYVEGCPQHIVQRGNNRDVCFYREADYAFYLQQLQQAAEKYQVSVHAYVLMTNHVHLLATPATRDGISRMIQGLGRSYVRYINITYQRTGTLWEGRFKSALVDSEKYFLIVSRYIELNPVRAAMVVHPGEYPWSSYRANGMGIDIALVTEHPAYMALGETPASRISHYRQFVEEQVAEIELDEVRLCTNKEWVIGSEKFRSQIQAANDRRCKRSNWGGDRKSESYKADQVTLTP